MGTSMASVAFRSGTKKDWMSIRYQIDEMFKGIDGLVSNLGNQQGNYAIVSPYGDMGMFLAELPEKISKLTGDYAVMTVCVDSDFAILELYNNGELIERASVGNVYGEIKEFAGEANIECWKPLLEDDTNLGKLLDAFHGNELFVEDQLRVISQLTGLPIFDDKLVYEML